MKKIIKQFIWKLFGINRILFEQEQFGTKLTTLLAQQQTLLNRIETYQSEILMSAKFDDTINGCPWLKYKNLSAGGWASDYGLMYTLFRILNDTHPHRILEFGLGQSSKLIHQYANYYDDTYAVTYEHDVKWIDFFKKGLFDQYKINIHTTELEETQYKGENTLSYKNNCKELIGQRFDLILIDAPFGSPRYSRSQILNIIPDCLSDSFCIIMDDYNRNGEKETINELKEILAQHCIKTFQTVYRASKNHCLICSENLHFLTTL
ncbi:MAG: hypothetical protein PUC50_03625 [Bacteroidales bacterium]|nr:hypothetical protein [Bacteroidales bacterium]